MFRIKKLDLYVLVNFLRILSVTFFICLFILLMQFLWKYVDEMIGKGLEISVLAEFFFYSALSLVPMALPLAILLASLMTFGDFGEKLELLAMKAAGISLFRIILPLILTITLISIGAFFFANNAIPKTQVKLWTLIYSMREKSPEIDIPENVFYSGISGYSIYVKKKNTKRNLLEKIMIYNLSGGFENITVTVADSARLQFTDDKNYLVLTLYNGETFENIKEQNPTERRKKIIPYRRESFEVKQTLIEFDRNFTKMNESVMQGKYVSKNIVQLSQTIDSMGLRIDSLSKSLGNEVIREHRYNNQNITNKNSDSTFLSIKSRNADSLYTSLSTIDKLNALKRASIETASMKNKIKFKKLEIEDNSFVMRRHDIEWHRKFTLSFACLIFFFIGAPLGAIIRKGGLGTPVVLSVFLFIVYYIIDNTGYKFARDGVWTAFEGMWLSASILLPLGIFLTYKAATDSVILNADAYIYFFKKFKIKKTK